METITQIEAGQHIKEAYMPYAMSTILDRALPDVKDGMKPIHRRILYSMYKAGIVYNRYRAKTREPISETMKIHNHGDVSIGDAIALMTEQNESLLYPYIDGEGAFGKVYSKDKPSDPRYTYCRLNKFSEEYFKDLKNNIIPMIGEDKDHLQPLVLSADFPSILIKNNTGIACGEACEWGSFNLSEVIDMTTAYINNKDIILIDYLKAPDFSSGGYLIYDKSALEKIYNTGAGSILLRAKYTFNKDDNCIEINEIPYSTTVDAIISKISNLMKSSDKYKSITDVRDETGFNKITEKEEMQIAIDVKKNTNIDILMKNLFKDTPLQSNFSFNMNCLVNYEPKVLGVKQVLDEWLKFREECIIKNIKYNIDKKSKQLHLLQGLEKVLLNIDKAINIIKNSNTDELVIINLMQEFNIDELQSNDIANIKLRNLNKDYILNKITLISTLQNELKELNDTLHSQGKINNIIISDLERVKKAYDQPRKTDILYENDIQLINTEDLIEDSNVHITLTKDNYFKKTLSTSLRGSTTQKLKDNDSILVELDSTNKSDILFFTCKGNCYKKHLYEFDDVKLSTLGTYLPNELDLEQDEIIIYAIITKDYKENLIIAFENGKVAKINLNAFSTKTNRSKLKNAYNTNSTIVNMFTITKDIDIICKSSIGKVLIINTNCINTKSSKNSQGVQILKSKNNSTMKLCMPLNQININQIEDIEYYRAVRTGVGSYLKKTDNIKLI